MADFRELARLSARREAGGEKAARRKEQSNDLMLFAANPWLNNWKTPFNWRWSSIVIVAGCKTRGVEQDLSGTSDIQQHRNLVILYYNFEGAAEAKRRSVDTWIIH